SSQARKDGIVVENDFCAFDSDNKFPPPRSAEIMIENRKKRLSDEFEFRTLLGEINHGIKELLYCVTDDGANISGKEGDLETWFGDEEVDQENDVEWQDDPYHLVDEPEEPKEISDMFDELDQAMDELDQ
ncbi:hypothetical protein Tco_0065473, partial [Tanacetum coccineum]